jgi:hypothetical protein
MTFAITLTSCVLSFANDDLKDITAGASSTASLSINSTTVTFPNADPDTTPIITASEGAISIIANAKTSKNNTVTLTVVAGGDLKSGGNTIAISNITWTAAGSGFVAGTLSKTTPKTVGSWTGSGNRTGTVTFRLANAWTYATGTYTATLTFILTAP